MEKTFKIDQSTACLMSLPVLRRKLLTRAPHSEGIGLRQSHRVRGLLEEGQEVMAYAKVFLFLPKGMPETVEASLTLIKTVYGLQRLDFRFPLHIAAYGEPAETLQAKSFQVFNYKRDMARVVEQLAGGEILPPHMLTTLNLTPVSRSTKISRDDLVLVVTGRLDGLALSESVKNSLSRHGNSYAVFLSDGIQACCFKYLSFIAHGEVSTDV